VILETYTEPSWLNKNRDLAHQRWFWTAQIQPNSDPQQSGDGIQWFSPELEQRPTKLAFSQTGIAEIKLPNGKITVSRQGNLCKTTRE
jgi:hypothetical protein